MAPHEGAIPFSSRCELCSEKNFDTHWIDVGPEGEGISCVTVDAMLRLCPAHRARLLQALGQADSERVEPNREMKGWGPPGS
jgi:hypothetical protein